MRMWEMEVLRQRHCAYIRSSVLNTNNVSFCRNEEPQINGHLQFRGLASFSKLSANSIPFRTKINNMIMIQ